MADALVSVIIPTIGRLEYIDEAIESALAQTRGPVEVIVVDDGATDGTAEHVARRPGVRVLSQGERTGISVARNRALGVARGELVVFLDDDDRLLPGAVEVGARELERRPGAALAFGRAHLIDADGAPRGVSPRVVSGTFADVLRGAYPAHPAAAVLRREAALAIGGFDVWRGIAQDYEFYARLSRRFAFHAHGEVVSVYRTHAANVRNTRGPQACLDAVLSVVEAHRARATSDEDRRACDEARRHWERIFGEALPWEAVRHARRGEVRNALLALAATLRHTPRDALLRVGLEALRRVTGREAA